MNTETIERYNRAAGSRGSEYVVHYTRQSGKDMLEFLEEYRDNVQMLMAKNYWFEAGYEDRITYNTPRS